VGGRLIETGALIAMSGTPSQSGRGCILNPGRAGTWMVGVKYSTEITGRRV